MANAPEGDGEPAEPLLPIVAAPKLDGSEANEEADEPIGETAAQASLSRSLRFALLAACIASAAALGSFVGSLSAAGVTRLWPAATASANTAAANTLQATKAELAELFALKANLDGASRGANSQFGKLADRLDRIERVQIEAATKLAHVADATDRLEKKTVTASAAPAAPVAPAAPETTGSIANSPPPAAPAEAKPADKILRDWIVQDVRAGHALVENSHGGVFDVAAGGMIPGLGRVDTIKRQDGQWIVVTARGLITEHN
jgi:hypothetical protein